MASPLSLVPAHVIVLVLLAVAALVAGHDAEGAYRAGQAAETGFTADIRRAVAFGLLFNIAIGIALAAAWLIELVATFVRVGRRTSPAGRAFARLGLATLPLLVFVVGHRLINPWLPDLVRQIGTLARGG